MTLASVFVLDSLKDSQAGADRRERFFSAEWVATWQRQPRITKVWTVDFRLNAKPKLKFQF
jgi:hypothetical protein